MEITKSRFAVAMTVSVVASLLIGVFFGVMVRANPDPGIIIYPDYLDMAMLTSDPTLSEGRLWYRSDLDRLKVATSDSDSKTVAWSDEDGKNSYDYNGIYYHTFFESIDGFGQSTTGTGTVTVNSGGLSLNTGTTQNSVSEIYKTNLYFSLAKGSWDNDRRFKTRWRFYSNSGQEAYLTIGYPGQSAVGFKVVNSTLYGYSCKLGSALTVDLATNIVGFGDYLVECVVDAGASVTWFVNGVQKGQTTNTSYIPTGDAYAHYLIYCWIRNTWAAAEKIAYLYEYKFLQEP